MIILALPLNLFNHNIDYLAWVPLLSIIWGVKKDLWDKPNFEFDGFYIKEQPYQKGAEPYSKRLYYIRIARKGDRDLGRIEGKLQLEGFDEQYLSKPENDDSVLIESDLFMFELDRDGKNVTFTKPDKSKKSWKYEELKFNKLKLTIGTEQTGLKSKEVLLTDVLKEAKPI
jgi:hypothetical protein